MLRAEASAEAGDRGSALDAFQSAIEIRPRPEAYFGAGALLAQAGRLEEARRHVEAGLALDPESIEGRDLHEALALRPPESE
jgi:Flp pilus assembly protein TadD